jgi:two-component system, OmpR family, alkaline phosphatase synthesis response regulator PhoP
MDGETAVEMIKNKSFDLIVLDIMLPKMDGFEVLEQVKGIPTILLTARSSVEDRVKGRLRLWCLLASWTTSLTERGRI